MLYHPGSKTAEFPLMLLEVLVKPVETDMLCAPHILRQSRYRETALRAAHRLLVLYHIEFRIDNDHLGILAFRELPGKRTSVNHNEGDRLPDLRRGKPYAFGEIHCLEHILDQLLQIGIVLVNIFGLLTQNRMTVQINR